MDPTRRNAFRVGRRRLIAATIIAIVVLSASPVRVQADLTGVELEGKRYRDAIVELDLTHQAIAEAETVIAKADRYLEELLFARTKLVGGLPDLRVDAEVASELVE